LLQPVIIRINKISFILDSNTLQIIEFTRHPLYRSGCWRN